MAKRLLPFGAVVDRRVVEFDGMACCALGNSHLDLRDGNFPYRALEALRDLYVPIKNRRPLEFYLDIYKNTESEGFIPSQFLREFYLVAADAEIVLLRQLDSGLPCGHSPENHIHALQKIILLLTKEEKVN